ncbi:MAG: hypothetical protein IPK26_06430 [Planctomycetes bacterium]|nr:hypothetical protein [Planctomycetota bacterium]
MTLSVLLAAVAAVLPQSPESPAEAAPSLQLPFAFVPNQGQWPGAAKYCVAQGPVRTWVVDRGLWVQAERTGDSPLGVAISLRFEGAAGGLAAEQRDGSRRNWLLGADSSRWVTDVPAFRRVRHAGLYPHTDLVLREQDGHVEYDLVLERGAKVRDVLVRVAGHDRMRLAADGALILDTALGELRQTPPTTWVTRADGSRQSLPSRFVILGHDAFGFDVAGWDGSDELTIDPGLVWGSLIGGSGDDRVVKVLPDSQGRVSVAGTTASSNFPTTPGSYKPVNSSGTDAFVALFNAPGDNLVFCTYVGGALAETCESAFVYSSAGSDRFAISGTTQSQNFPVTSDRYQGFASGGTDGFVAVINNTGNALSYGSYFGAGGNQEQVRIWVQPNGNIFLAGRTTGQLATTGSAYQPQLNGVSDAFFAVLNRQIPSITTLQYCSHFGGPGDETQLTSIHAAPNDIATMGMATTSTGIPATATYYQNAHPGSGGQVAGHIFCLQPNASGQASLIYSSYFGQSSGVTDRMYVEMDMGGFFTVTATTTSTTWPTSTTAYQRTYGGGASDGLICRFNPGVTGGTALMALTYLGGNAEDVIESFWRDPLLANPIISVCGHTLSANAPITAAAFQRTPYSASRSGYIAALDPTLSGASQLLYGSYFDACGTGDDRLFSVHRSQTSGIITVAGYTDGTVAPASPGAFRRSSLGGQEGIIGCVDNVARPATFGTFGTGCGAVGFVPSITSGNSPRMCTQFQVTVSNLRPNGLGLMFLGLSNTDWFGIPLPRDLVVAGMPGCFQLVSVEDTFVVAHAGTTANWGFLTPGLPDVYGLDFFFQWGEVDPAANSLGLALSQGGRGTVVF